MLKRIFQFIVLFILIFILLPANLAGDAQSKPDRRPIDMVIVIDNSCSMFPRDQIIAGCDAWGSDPTFLRIVGTDLFISRLGFGEPNEADYQLGIIGFGKEATLISPLQSLGGQRDTLAGLIAKPKPEAATQLVPALLRAYDELENSPNRSLDHIPAIVLITDGVPYPPEGQTNTEIEKLVSGKSDIPLFLVLLQNKDNPSQDYENYISFWEELQTVHPHINVYRIRQASEIKDTYNSILSQLQSTIPSKGMVVTSGEPLKLYVGEYIQTMILTVIRNSANSPGTVILKDPLGNLVDVEGDPGVIHFLGSLNPIEVISISSPRLANDLKGQYWTLTSDADVTVMVDREGGYRINYLQETVLESELNSVYRSIAVHNPGRGEFLLKFELVDWEGKRVLDAQIIQGTVITPDGEETQLPGGIKPDNEGVYTIPYDAAAAYPPILNEPGQISFKLSAGVADETSTDKLPITNSRLLVDFKRIPTLRSVAPLPVVCQTGYSPNLRVSVGDHDSFTEGVLRVLLGVGNQDIEFESKEPGLYSGDLGQICTELISQRGCSSSGEEEWEIHLDLVLPDGKILSSERREVPVQVVSPDCTATPIPTPTATPLPPPPPIPDSDGDGVNDEEDLCPTQWGMVSYNGCIPWNAIWISSGMLGLLMVTSSLIWPWIRVRTFANPPDGYIRAWKDGKPLSDPISIHRVGIKRRTDRIVIGSSRWKAHIRIPGLQGVEVIIERKSISSVLRDPKEKNPFAYIDDEVRLVYTSDPKTTLRISLDPDKL
jgi:hypothetical protein